MGSKSDVSAFFWLRFRNGLGTKPAGVLLFRMRLFLVGSKSNVSAVFWLRFRMVWALYFFLFSGFQKRRFGIFPAAVSQWLGHKTCWGSCLFACASQTQKGWSIPETCHPSPNHCFDRPHPTLLSPLLGVGGMGGSPSIIKRKAHKKTTGKQAGQWLAMNSMLIRARYNYIQLIILQRN